MTRDVQARTVRVAEAIAATEDKVAATFDHLADDHPQRAERLRALARSARRQAALERRWTREHAPQVSRPRKNDHPGPQRPTDAPARAERQVIDG